MAETQLASMFIGNPNIDDVESQAERGSSNNIFILDGQTDEVLGHINKKYVIDNEHEKDLPSHKDYFRFTVLADNKHAKHLTKRNGLIVPGEDGELLEFRIFESIKYRDNEGLKIEVHALATYLDLKTQKIFDPQKTSSETAQQHANLALAGTEWQVGEIDFKGIRTLEFDNPFNSYDYILRIAREFGLEPRFYIKTDGNKVTGRYVDLVEQIGEFRGRTIEFGRDLQSIERKEDTSNVVTALWIYGPQREDGTRLKVFVEDDEARQRWGRRGQHIIDYYEPQTENDDITEERLKTLGEMELKKRVNAVVTYEAEILDLENVPGLENKKIRFGDTIRIKDIYFNPALYVEARAFNVKRDVFNKSKKTVQLGDYREYTEDEVKALFRQMQVQIQQKISAVQAEQMIEEYAEPKKVESPTPPPLNSEGDNPIWVDTSQEPYVPHVADTESNEWVRMTLSDDDVLVNEVNYNGLKWSKDEGLIVERSDGKVRSILNGTDGIKVQQKIGSEWVDVYYVDENGNVKYAGDLEGASGTFGKVSVTDGDFTLKDSVTSSETIINTGSNIVMDHSFELIKPLAAIEPIDPNNPYIASIMSVDSSSFASFFGWWNNTNPQQARILRSYDAESSHIFAGLNSIILRGQSYGMWDQICYIPEQFRQTNALSLSCYVAPFEKTLSNVDVSLRIQLVNSSGNWLQDLASATYTIDHTKKYNWQRVSVTFKGNLNLGGNRLRIRLLLNNNTSNAMLLCDGVQLVPFEHPTLYEPENSLYQFMNGIGEAPQLVANNLAVTEYATIHDSWIGNAYIGNIEHHTHSTLSLINGWQNYGDGYTRAAYTKTADGYVHLRGLIQNGAIGTVCGTLPVGCRPYQSELFAVVAGNGHFARITINSSGNVTVTSATLSSPPFISLSGISFLAEN